MQYIEKDNYVMKREEVVTPTQTAIVETFYDQLYHTDLTYEPSTKIVRATVYDYKNILQTGYTMPITFNYDGQQITVTPINGSAEITFNSTVPGEHVVKTVNPSIRNGEVTIIV